MAVTRTPWTTIVDGETVALGLLIAGVPWLLVPPGVSVTAVAWTADPDPAWHVGTSPTSKPWLDTSDQSPPLTIEERASPVQGTLEVSDLTFHLLDVDGAATELFGARDAMPYTILAADLGASATTITTDVPSASGVYGSSGTVHLGRERITFSGTSCANLTGCTRGTAGTRARPHRVNARDPSKHAAAQLVPGFAHHGRNRRAGVDLRLRDSGPGRRLARIDLGPLRGKRQHGIDSGKLFGTGVEDALDVATVQQAPDGRAGETVELGQGRSLENHLGSGRVGWIPP